MNTEEARLEQLYARIPREREKNGPQNQFRLAWWFYRSQGSFDEVCKLALGVVRLKFPDFVPKILPAQTAS